MLRQTRQPMSVFLIPVNQSKQLWHHSTPEYIWHHLPKITKTCQTGVLTGVPSLCLSQATQLSYRAQEPCQGAVCCTCRWIRLTALSRVTSGLFHKWMVLFQLCHLVSKRSNYELIECDTCRSCLRAKLLGLMSIDFLLGASKNFGVGS